MILVAVALTVSTPAAIVMLVIQLVYQQVENYIIYPIVYQRAVELSAFTTIVAVLIAGAILGVVGAILAVPFAAVFKIVLREAGAPRRAQMSALRAEPTEAAATISFGSPGREARNRSRLKNVVGDAIGTRMRDLLDQALGQLRYEPTEKRMRATSNGRRRHHAGLLVWEPRRIVPSYAVPAADIAAEPTPARRERRRLVRACCTRASRSPCTPRPASRLDRRRDGRRFRLADADLAGYVVLDFDAFDVARGGRAVAATRATRSTASTSGPAPDRSGSSSTARSSPRPPGRPPLRDPAPDASTCRARTSRRAAAERRGSPIARTRARRPTGRSSSALETSPGPTRSAAGRGGRGPGRFCDDRFDVVLIGSTARARAVARGGHPGRVRRLVPARFAVERRLDAAGLEAVACAGLVGEQPLERGEHVGVEPLGDVGADDRERLVGAHRRPVRASDVSAS